MTPTRPDPRDTAELTAAFQRGFWVGLRYAAVATLAALAALILHDLAE